jgi:hypothetical protein
VTVVGVSNVGPVSDGPWAGWDCIGCSLAVGPGGAVLATGPFGRNAQALMVIDVEPAVPKMWGTALRGALSRRGYNGP